MAREYAKRQRGKVLMKGGEMSAFRKLWGDPRHRRAEGMAGTFLGGGAAVRNRKEVLRKKFQSPRLLSGNGEPARFIRVA